MDPWWAVFRDVCCTGSFWPLVLLAGLCFLLYPRKRGR